VCITVRRGGGGFWSAAVVLRALKKKVCSNSKSSEIPYLSNEIDSKQGEYTIKKRRPS
jgi:hypothetical protein